MVTIFIAGIILLSGVGFFTGGRKKDNPFWVLWLFWSIFILSIIVFGESISKPTAMDVYQHKTELKKTFIGKEAVDSTVVFKKH